MLSDLKLNDARILDPVREFPGDVTRGHADALAEPHRMQQQSKHLATRQIIPARSGPARACLDYFATRPTKKRCE